MGFLAAATASRVLAFRQKLAVIAVRGQVHRPTGSAGWMPRSRL